MPDPTIFHHTFHHPKPPPKASVFIVHGMQEHSGRYEEFATFLAENGDVYSSNKRRQQNSIYPAWRLY